MYLPNHVHASRDSTVVRRSRLPVIAAFAVPLVLIGCLIFGLPVQTTILEARASNGGRSSLSEAISSATSPHLFDLVSWEATALADSVAKRAKSTLLLPALAEAERLALVDQYHAAAAEASQLQRQIESISVRGGAQQDSESRALLQQRLAEAERRRDQLVPTTEGIIASQIDDYLAHSGVARGLLRLDWRWSFPPLTFSIDPPVLFRFQRLPLLLVVAPRDRIQVLQGLFLQPRLSLSEIEGVEEEIDRQGVQSLVIPIGGFAAYPSMIPTSPSLKDTLTVVAHEWVHHYLAMHPLGQSYFSDYPLRSINETVADLVGREIGDAVFQRFYSSAASPNSPSSLADGQAASSSSSFDFAQAMAETRRTAEDMLNRGDVAMAEQYLAERKLWFVSQGYYLRKLNTAYLTFYGAYAGSGNSYEPKLRHLRQRSHSLADFLHQVEGITSEQDFESLTRGLD